MGHAPDNQNIERIACRAGIGSAKGHEERLSVFPVFMKVEGRHAVIVGNGDEALAKARLLQESRIAIRLVAPRPERDLAAFVIQGDIEHIVHDYRAELLDGALLVFAATGSAELDASIVADARERAIPANAVDRPDLCDFYTPALVNRAPVAVAIGSEGSGPVLTQLIRAKVEAMLPVTLGAVARLAANYRKAVDRLLPRGAARRHFWRNFFEGPVAEAIHAGDGPAARRNASRLLRGETGLSGHVSLVGAGPGAADLLTLRAQRMLLQADVILYDALVPEDLAAMGRRDAQRIRVGKTKGAHSLSQQEICELMISHAREGRRVVRLKSGDPMIFGRAGDEIAALREAGISHDVVPGITAALAAAGESGIPLTLRGVASSVIFATGHDRDMNTLPDWAGLALRGSTVAVYMGRTVAASVASRLMQAGMAGDTPVAMIESASRPDRQCFAGDLDQLSRVAPGRSSDRPALILIGRALAAADLSTAFNLADIDRAQVLAA